MASSDYISPTSQIPGLANLPGEEEERYLKQYAQFF